MFKDIIIGQYFPGKSPIHKIDPRIKIILTIVYIALIFMIDKPVSYVIFAVYTVTIVIVSGVPFKLILKGIRPMLWIFIFTAVMNLFAVPGETLISIPLFRFALKITREGVITAVTISVRLLLLIMGTSLLTLTTSPLMLTDGIEHLLEPLKKIKVPSHEIAMMMSIAIRFIPTLAEETDKIQKAQLARGADFESGNIVKRAKSMLPLLIPLFISAFRRADDLATAMDSRCYHGGKNRTRMKEMNITFHDIKSTAVFVLCAGILLIAEFVIEF